MQLSVSSPFAAPAFEDSLSDSNAAPSTSRLSVPTTSDAAIELAPAARALMAAAAHSGIDSRHLLHLLAERLAADFQLPFAVVRTSRGTLDCRQLHHKFILVRCVSNLRSSIACP